MREIATPWYWLWGSCCLRLWPHTILSRICGYVWCIRDKQGSSKRLHVHVELCLCFAKPTEKEKSISAMNKQKLSFIFMLSLFIHLFFNSFFSCIFPPGFPIPSYREVFCQLPFADMSSSGSSTTTAGTSPAFPVILDHFSTLTLGGMKKRCNRKSNRINSWI